MGKPGLETLTLSMSIEDAFKVVVSGGIVSPEAATINATINPAGSSEARQLEATLESSRPEVRPL